MRGTAWKSVRSFSVYNTFSFFHFKIQSVLQKSKLEKDLALFSAQGLKLGSWTMLGSFICESVFAWFGK